MRTPPNSFEVYRCFDADEPVKHDVLNRALIEAEVCSKRDFVWVINTRMFHDPAEDKKLRNHVGSNGEIVDGVVRHKRFPDF